MPAKRDRSYLIGQVFNRWTVLSLTENHKNVFCKCSCGKVKKLLVKSFLANKTKSCGCFGVEILVKRSTKHGACKTKAYRTYRSVLSRCNPKTTVKAIIRDYVSKGITVCDRWKHSFENFLEDMGEPPSLDHSIDRIDNNKGYSPDNCRWATRKEQQTNRSTTRWFTYNGVTMSMKDWADKLNGCESLISNRIKMGWPIEKILSTPNTQPWRKRT